MVTETENILTKKGNQGKEKMKKNMNKVPYYYMKAQYVLSMDSKDRMKSFV